MPALDESLQQKMLLLGAKGLKRQLIETQTLEDVRVTRAGRELISFSSNDYLGLSHHPQVIEAAQKALADGVGAGASRLITGNSPHYARLEHALAAYKSTQAACVFGSGYLAHLGVIPALVGAGDLIVADKYIHASMVDAARLSGATLVRYAHNNMEHCRMLLAAQRAEHHHCLMMSESVFSMDGDRAPLSAMRALADEFDAWLLCDDAHGLGVLPKQATIADIEIGTLSKSLGGYGGYVCGSDTLIEYLQTAARTLIYSTALPPSVIAGCDKALDIISSQPELVAMPLQNARYFTSLLGINPAHSAIVPIILKENDKTLAAASYLEEKGFLVSAIRAPTVPEHTARLRFSFCADHQHSQIEQLARIIEEQAWLQT